MLANIKNSRVIAQESPQVAKKRHKIEKDIENSRAKLNPGALAKMRSLLETKLGKIEYKGKTLKGKVQVPVFDENTHSVMPHSKMITRLMKRLEREALPTLQGRVKEI